MDKAEEAITVAYDGLEAPGGAAEVAPRNIWGRAVYERKRRARERHPREHDDRQHSSCNQLPHAYTTFSLAASVRFS